MLKLRSAFLAWVLLLLWVTVTLVAAQDAPGPSVVLDFTSHLASEATPTPSSKATPTVSKSTANITLANTTAKVTPPAPGPMTKATPSPNASSSPALANDMRMILRKVGPLPCSESVRARMFALLYESNVELHDQCIAETGYQFFPYTGELPTATQIVAIVKSTPCMQIQSAAVIGNFPECDVDYVSVRTAAETYLRVKKDVDDGRTPPTQAQFYELYNLNRVVNLLNDNASLIEEAFRDTPTAASVSLTEMTRLMNPIILSPGVSLGADMKILIAEDATATPPSTTSSSSASSASQGEETTPPPTRAAKAKAIEAASSSADQEEPQPVKKPVNATKKVSAGLSLRQDSSHIVCSVIFVAATSIGTMLL